MVVSTHFVDLLYIRIPKALSRLGLLRRLLHILFSAISGAITLGRKRYFVSDGHTSKMSALPVRSFMDGANTKWRHGYQPNYDAVNEKFMAEKTMNHKDGSLEQVVENLVKTWEMESSHKMDDADWKSVDKKVFTISSNGGKKFNLDDNISIGNYNILMCESPLYNAVKETNQSSHDLFRNVFKTGFAWEVLQVFSGPPLVSFTWRHWGTFEGDYKGTKATGETIEMYGNCVVKVNDDMKIQSIDVYYDPNPFLMKLTNWKSGAGCPVAK